MPRGRWRCPRAAAAALLAVAAVTLQGCGIFGSNKKSFSTGRKAEAEKEEEEEPAVRGPMPDQQSIHNQLCDAIIESQSDAFQEAAQKGAENYYQGLVKAFSLNFIKYPFCLENKRFMVDRMETHLRKLKRYEEVTIAEMDNLINDTLAKVYPKHRDRWRECCKDWTDQNSGYQQTNVDMVREVLQIPREVDDDQLKAEIAAFFDWQIWWDFFGKLAGKGCTKHYTMMCYGSSAEARDQARQKIGTVMNNPDMTWYAFSDPESERGQGPERESHDPHAMHGDEAWSKPLEVRERENGLGAHGSEDHQPSGHQPHKSSSFGGGDFLQLDEVPVEVGARGHQIRSRHRRVPA